MRLIAFAPLLAALSLATDAGAAAGSSAADLVVSPAFKAAVAKLGADHDRTVADIVTLTEIPAPPFKEAARAQAYLALLKAHGLKDAEMDTEGNVMGVRPGAKTGGKGPYVVIAAHLDTVFPEGTDVKVRREGTRLMAPGIGDDTRALAVLLAYLRAMEAARITTTSDILFVGNVGEEGPGNLRGVRYLFNSGKYKGKISAFFSMDGNDPANLVDQGVGSKRYHAIFRGPGGHSYGAFGMVNPMAAMSRAVTDLYAIKPPTEPKTTYSASVTGGGTSVNAIPNEVFMDFDIRSVSADELAGLDGKLQTILAQAVEAENAQRSTRFGKVTVEAKVIGERPAGRTDPKAAIVVATHQAVAALGYTPSHNASSTDANLPMSLGIPAVTIGSGGAGGRAHALDEWIDVEKGPSVKGMSVGLAALLTVAGME